ncbi:MAG: alpha/beta fold hydrolase [Victivallales bacterium]|nr:alpha/beta fold hydrolase [Victivallales bacterium]
MSQERLSETCSPCPGVRERCVTFAVEGTMLAGILAMPADGAARCAVLLSHGWSGHRCGPAGVLVHLARCLAADGCATLRFDFRGRGESGGDGLESTLATMSADLCGAEAELRRLTGLARTTILGMCSGGNVAIGSLDRLPQVDSLVMLSVYPFSDGDSFGRNVGRFRHLLQSYLAKACSWQTWLRLFRGEASLGRVLGVLLHPFLKRGESRRHEGEMASGDAKSNTHGRGLGQSSRASAHESRLSDTGKAPRRHLAALRPDLPVLMVYGTGDPDAEAARRYFGDYARERNLPVRFLSIEKANHNYSSATWHRQVGEAVLAFLK